MKYKLLVLDVDGTLLNEAKELSPRNLAAVRKAQQMGVQVVLSSGRAVGGILPLAHQLELENYGGYVLAYNGGYVRDMKTGEVLFEKHLESDVIPFVYKLARDSQPRILIRPRRFGKSTLLSTLEELFLHGVKPYDGHDSCFKGLAIEKTWQEEGHYLVLHLDLYCINSCCSRVEQFHRKLIYEIASFCKEHQLPVRKDAQDFTQVFGDMLRQLPPSSLVLLVDEYDAYRKRANYLRKRLEDVLDIPFDRICAHEFVASAPEGLRALDIAKGLLDRGIHAPTIYFPLIVKECLMAEPTETESKETLDEYVDALRDIVAEGREHPEKLAAAPQTLPVRRLDETAAARNMILTEDMA